MEKTTGCVEKQIMASSRGQFLSPHFSVCQDVCGQAQVPHRRHQLYSPDLAPCYFFLSSIIKPVLKQAKFETVDAMTTVIKGLSGNRMT
ncbi:hypothetical protein AVEN_17892-1 [Araneus ventricosus]|uniref:Uncharacterized protein n=1 Tax=Araneus ventricosus TaxID=182803 RepID=A0A4Y2I545_ARAVE|nr:hypothetical protein AVEN_17892-1 [Araneus ventricosus]